MDNLEWAEGLLYKIEDYKIKAVANVVNARDATIKKLQAEIKSLKEGNVKATSDLLELLEGHLDDTKDFNKLMHVLSRDNDVKSVAKFREMINKIAFKVKLSAIKETKHPEGKPIRENEDVGSFVSVRPCAEKFNKTYLGIYIGDAALSSLVKIDDKAIVCEWGFYNPAILIPEINKIVYGMESWWSMIESEDDLKKITDLDIENVWYVKALKAINSESLSKST